MLGITDKKGALTPGLDADLVIIDDEGNLFQTWKFGEKVFDVDEPIVSVKQMFKRVSGSKWENIPFGERFMVPEPSLKLVEVPAPSGVKVH